MNTNKEKQLNQRARRALRKLPKYRKVILYIELSIRVLVYKMRSLRTRPRARVHWAGHAHRPRRPERILFVVLFFASMLIFEPREYMLWAILWGGGAAIFVNLCAINSLLPRRKRHWVGR